MYTNAEPCAGARGRTVPLKLWASRARALPGTVGPPESLRWGTAQPAGLCPHDANRTH